MRQIFLYSLLLLSGIVCSQILSLDPFRAQLHLITMICLAYIMIEVGLEFTIDKKNLKGYGTDYLIAATAAAFPWIFCAVYFIAVFGNDWKEALLIGRFAAPTSAGVLFTLLAAAGLGTTWLFKKARILAIFDDLDTVLFMIPLQMIMVGFKTELLAVAGLIFVILAAAYRWLHAAKLPAGKFWILIYSIMVVGICWILERGLHIHLEVLLPAFAIGCILYNPHDPAKVSEHVNEHKFLEPENKTEKLLDGAVKGFFMFLVGCSLPKIQLGGIPWTAAFWHVAALTLLSNIGKCFPVFCYRGEVPLRERLALSVAMFPRGEVGAGVLLVSIGYHLNSLSIGLAGLSLALNLILTGFFISAVLWLSQEKIQRA